MRRKISDRKSVFHRPGEEAFTFLELLVVMLLIGLSFGILLPRLKGIFAPPQRAFDLEFENLLREARLKAFYGGSTYAVMIYPEERKVVIRRMYDRKKIRSLEIPPEYEIKERGLVEDSDSIGLFFFFDGTSSGGEVELLNHRNRTGTVLIVPRTLFYVERRDISPK